MSQHYAVILAAGKGTRMVSPRPKPLMKVCGRSMVSHILRSVVSLPGVERVVVVVGHEAELVEREIARVERPSTVEVVSVRQSDQRGTGDAVRAGLSRLPDLLPGIGDSGADLLVVPSDTPLITTGTLEELFLTHARARAAATVLTMEVDNPSGYGRIVRGRHSTVERIVEDRDLVADERAIVEVNTGVYVFDLSVLPAALRRVAPKNAQQEYYLTDVIELLGLSGYQIAGHPLSDPAEAWGVNDRNQLVVVEEEMRRRIIRRHLGAGVMLVRPDTITIDAQVTIGAGTTVWPNAQILGASEIGSNVEIGPECRLIDTVVHDDAQLVKVDAVGATIGARSMVGPYVAIRPGGAVAPDSVVESFSIVK
ncbi:MAG: NTP transferase domain-containing protein [Ferrimicrobium sp.]